MKRQSIYIETSFISYLAARRSRDLVASAWQEVSREFWDIHRKKYDLFISELVVEECGMGDVAAVESRMAFLRGIPELQITDEVKRLANAILVERGVPERAAIDALHIALAVVAGVDFMHTWNCRHLNNPVTKPRVRDICRGHGYVCPEICTPFEITEGANP